MGARDLGCLFRKEAEVGSLFADVGEGMQELEGCQGSLDRNGAQKLGGKFLDRAMLHRAF